MALAVKCGAKRCSYEYIYQKYVCRRDINTGINNCSYQNTQYRYCAQKWGSHPQKYYGAIEMLFGDNDRIARIDSTGSNSKCEDRSDIENRYANNNPGKTCSMDAAKRKYALAAYTFPCWDNSATRRARELNNEDYEEDIYHGNVMINEGEKNSMTNNVNFDGGEDSSIISPNLRGGDRVQMENQ